MENLPLENLVISDGEDVDRRAALMLMDCKDGILNSSKDIAEEDQSVKARQRRRKYTLDEQRIIIDLYDTHECKTEAMNKINSMEGFEHVYERKIKRWKHCSAKPMGRPVSQEFEEEVLREYEQAVSKIDWTSRSCPFSYSKLKQCATKVFDREYHDCTVEGVVTYHKKWLKDSRTKNLQFTSRWITGMIRRASIRERISMDTMGLTSRSYPFGYIASKSQLSSCSHGSADYSERDSWRPDHSCSVDSYEIQQRWADKKFSPNYLQTQSSDSFDHHHRERGLTVPSSFQHRHFTSADSLELQEEVDESGIKVAGPIPKHGSFYDVNNFEGNPFGFEECFDDDPIVEPIGKGKPPADVRVQSGLPSISVSSRLPSINEFDEPGFELLGDDFVMIP